MARILETEKDTLHKKQVFHERFNVSEWLMNTESARIYIGNFRFIYIKSEGIDLQTQENILIKFVRQRRKLLMYRRDLEA
jgi:hypothetical protein